MGLIIKFYDVEHGSCTHIITPNGKHFVVDLGTKDDHSVCKYLKDVHLHDTATIDYLLLTHLHEDHIKDLPNLDVYHINPRILYRPKKAFDLTYNTAKDNDNYKRIVEKANQLNRAYNQPINEETDPKNPDYNGGVTIKLFTPNDNDITDEDPNSYSCVVTLEYLGYKFVLTGDNPANILKNMVLEDEELRTAIKSATVLLAPHHGRDGEFCEEFVKIVNPRVTVISDSTIKYKSQEYSAQLYANHTRGVKWGGKNRSVFTTRSDGTITFEIKTERSWSIGTDKSQY